MQMQAASSVVGSSPFASSEVGAKLTWSQVASAPKTSEVRVPGSMQNRLDPWKPLAAGEQPMTEMGLIVQGSMQNRPQPILVRQC
jgi:hypothetical protein